jgi:branched-chain amino acid aminotransferase
VNEESRTVVWVDGGLVDSARAGVHWSDHGLTVGDGVFETIELRNGRPFALTRHLERLRCSAEGLGIGAPSESLVERAVGDVCSEWGDEAGRLRITVTSGPGPMGSARPVTTRHTVLVTAGAMTVLETPTRVVTVPYTRNERGALAGLKTTSYAENVVALADAGRRGASEALFANTVGNLCEGTGSNVFVGLGERLVTPPLGSGCLAGITRELLLEALRRAGREASVEDVPMAAMSDAKEIFLVSTSRHVQPVSHLDDRELPSHPGPLTAEASRIWHEAYDDQIDP